MESSLRPRRIAAFMLNALTRELQLGNLAYHFEGDAAHEWAVVSMTEVRALKNDRLVAEIFLSNHEAEIVITDVYEIIRSEHLSDFDPLAHGIAPNDARDFKGDRLRPDLRANMEIPDDIPMLDADPMPVQRQPGHRAIIVEGSLG